MVFIALFLIGWIVIAAVLAWVFGNMIREMDR